MNTFYPNSPTEIQQSRVVIGFVDSFPVTYLRDYDSVICKGGRSLAPDFIKAYKSPLDREHLSDVVILEKNQYFYQIGCFTLSAECMASLINSLSRCRIQQL